MKKPSNHDFDESRAGFRSGEGSDSVMHHLMLAARRRQKNIGGFRDSHLTSQPPQEGEGKVDVQLP